MDQHPLLARWLKDGQVPPHMETVFHRLQLKSHISGIALDLMDSPMMKQYRKAREDAPRDALVFFRMGDFYELFGLDALIASDICKIALTSRDKSSEHPIPMAGVPVSACKNAAKKCLDQGFKVAICEQMEEAAGKTIIGREIIRVMTPAVPGTDLMNLDSEEWVDTTYLAVVVPTSSSYHPDNSTFILGYAEASTGELELAGPFSLTALIEEIKKLTPKEILAPKIMFSSLSEFPLSELPNPCFTDGVVSATPFTDQQKKTLVAQYFPAQELLFLEKQPFFLDAIFHLLFYLKETQKHILRNFQKITVRHMESFLELDDNTLKHLDFFETSSKEKKGSLFWFLNHCRLHGGSRRLAKRLLHPFLSHHSIKQSSGFIDDFFHNPAMMALWKVHLTRFIDIERYLNKLSYKTISLVEALFLKESLESFLKLFDIVKKEFPETSVFQFLDQQINPLDPSHSALSHFLLLKELSQNLNLTFKNREDIDPTKDSVFFKENFSTELDNILFLERNFETELSNLERSEKERTQISTLKIGYTNVFGYYFEVSKGKLDLIPKDFIRKQTLSTGERFITPRLKELEEDYLRAKTKKEILIKDLSEAIRQKILFYSSPLLTLYNGLSEIDVSYSFALRSLEQNWTKPFLTDSNEIMLKRAFHPILKSFYRGKDFIENDISLTKDSLIHLVTGPNMAGKSTLMRQIALIQVLAQMGSYVPAHKAEIGLCDKIFTRIGSGDFALKSQSTFMVEMLETSHMLKHATSKSLLLLDEVGRGTSTYDGLSLAYGILVDIHNRLKSRTLFSTHYHELYGFVKDLKQIKPMFLSVCEHKNSIQFSYEYKEGSIGKSYGILVAKLAGLPSQVIEEAEQILSQLENPLEKKISSLEKKEELSLPLSQETTPLSGEIIIPTTPLRPLAGRHSKTDKYIEYLDIDAITPRQALQILYQLKQQLKEKESSRHKNFHENSLFEI